MQNKPAISENTVQEILNQIACIKKRQSGNQKQDLDDIKGMIVTSHRYFKEKLKELFPTDTRQQEKVEAVSLYDKILSRITPYLQPKFFLFSAGIIIGIVSLILNVRFMERMQQLQDNDIKYRYLLMKGKADGNMLNLLDPILFPELSKLPAFQQRLSLIGIEAGQCAEETALSTAALTHNGIDVAGTKFGIYICKNMVISMSECQML